MLLRGKHILIGIGSGIAAYKIPELIRLFKREGAEVKVATTKNALQFVTELTLQTLSGYKVYSDVFAAINTHSTEHISLPDWADLLIVAPATADVICKMAAGIADDALTTTLAAMRKPVVVAPAMNDKMYAAEALQQALITLTKRANMTVLDCAEGELACGTTGKGRMQEPEVLLEAAKSALTPKDMAGRRVLLTAGPTQEAIDPVRFISNRSSGKMGIALTKVLLRHGAEVRLVAGPMSEELRMPVYFEGMTTLTTATTQTNLTTPPLPSPQGRGMLPPHLTTPPAEELRMASPPAEELRMASPPAEELRITHGAANRSERSGDKNYELGQKCPKDAKNFLDYWERRKKITNYELRKKTPTAPSSPQGSDSEQVRDSEQGRGNDIQHTMAGVSEGERKGMALERIDIVTAEEMYEACVGLWEQCDMAILAAAVADQKPAEVADHKLKKNADLKTEISMVETPDIARALAETRREGQRVIGFALETNDEMQNALSKLHKKNLDMIVLNSTRDKGATFGTDTNKVTIIDKNGEVTELPLLSKEEVAEEMMKIIDN